MTSETRKEFNETFNAVATFTSLGMHSKINLNEKTTKFDKSFQQQEDEEEMLSKKEEVMGDQEVHYPTTIGAPPLKSSKH